LIGTLVSTPLGTTNGTPNGGFFSTPTPASIERQSFDPWGERRAPETLVSYRATDADPFRSSAQDYDRGYTGHEQLDDSGLIHMNGRIYDPELGRMLSPDPFVQVPEYSQNFNRYSYVMNNPLNLTDPSGFSWLSKAFKKIGNWVKENWRTLVSIVFAAILFVVIGPGSFMGMFSGSMFSSGWAVGASIGALSGAFNAAINGGNFGDILRGAVIGGIQGGIAGGLLHGLGEAASEAGGFFTKEAAMHIAGHGVLGGAANEAMGGKFQDGFLSAAAGAGASYFGPFQNTDGASGVAARTIQAGIVGGTASALGGGKFANGAWTASFQHLLNAELVKPSEVRTEIVSKVIDSDSQVIYGLRLIHGDDVRYLAFNGEAGIVAPRSVDINENFLLANLQGTKNLNPMTTAKWFKAQVQNKGPWDFKQLKGIYQNFGNFHFGFVGFAAGINEGILLRQAGLAQIAAGTSQSGWGKPSGGPYGLLGGSGSFGDDPVDQYYIRQGYKAGLVLRNKTIPFI
jgi:RHS repeat-associated protein